MSGQQLYLGMVVVAYAAFMLTLFAVSSFGKTKR